MYISGYNESLTVLSKVNQISTTRDKHFLRKFYPVRLDIFGDVFSQNHDQNFFDHDLIEKNTAVQ